MPDTLTIQSFQPEHEPALVPMWRASFEHGVGVAVPDTLEGHRRYFAEHVLGHASVHVALRDGALVGFMATTPTSVVQLYVHVDHLGQRVGTRLLELAKRRSDGVLLLYTFARNTRARRFYEGHGFEIVEHGFEPVMQLDDVTYRWSRADDIRRAHEAGREPPLAR